MRNARMGMAMLATAALLASGIATQPASAQPQSREPYDSGPFSGPYGWSGRTFSERTDHLGSDLEGPDRSSREQFWRGYRAGRFDERRLAEARHDERGPDGADVANYGAAMEFLDQAQRRMERGDLRAAWVALGRAETRLATRTLPEGADDEAATGAAVGAVRAARQALRDRDVQLARARTARAMDAAERGSAVGRRVPGTALAGSGVPGPAEPFLGGGRSSSRGGTDRND